jgi:predicted MPP superfamily phosphohydrolase
MFGLFFSIIIALICCVQWYLFRAYRRWVTGVIPHDRQRVWRRCGFWFLLAGDLLFFSRVFLSRIGWHDHPLTQAVLVYPGGIFFASILLVFLILLVKDILHLPIIAGRRVVALIRGFDWSRSRVSPIPRSQTFSPDRRRFLRVSGVTMAAVPFGLSTLGALTTSRDYDVIRLSLFFQNLPSGLDGLTIVQVSDIHSGAYMVEGHIREIFDIVRSLHPQLIVLTGDFVDAADEEIPPVYNALDMLKAEVGVFGCLGNHDHYATAEKVTGALAQKGVTVLSNAHRTLTINGELLSLVGVDDAGTGRSNFARLDQAMAGLDQETFTIMLTHRPRFFPEAKKAGMDLTLAGHTHGGQVGVEFGGIAINPVYLFHHYAKGLYVEEGKQLYVNAGVGMVGVPVRWIKPEITLMTLHAFPRLLTVFRPDTPTSPLPRAIPE